MTIPPDIPQRQLSSQTNEQKQDWGVEEEEDTEIQVGRMPERFGSTADKTRRVDTDPPIPGHNRRGVAAGDLERCVLE